VIGYDDKYVTTQSDILYFDYQTVVFMKRQVIMVLSNAGSTSDPYTITIPMNKATISPSPGTSYTDIIACGTTKLSSTNHLITTILTGMSQVPPLPKNQKAPLYAYPLGLVSKFRTGRNRL
jgi:hypothetical protein